VKREDALYIGPCKYAVLVIERSESRSAEPPKFVDTDYYSQELKLILAKEYKYTNEPAEMGDDQVRPYSSARSVIDRSVRPKAMEARGSRLKAPPHPNR
jgi:hypothetical protein